MRPLPAIEALRSKVDRACGSRDKVARDLDKTKAEVKDLENETALLDLVCGLFRTLIDQEVTASVQAVEKLQTEGLQTVFDDQKLKVTATVKTERNKVSVDLITSQVHPGGMEVEGESVESFGGAVSTVQSILLRVIILFRRGLRPLMLLDETLPAFDANYVTNMGRFLSRLCARLNLDILLVAHNPAFVDAADHAYKIAKRNGQAKFEKIR